MRGAASDTSGYYLIKDIPVGKYSVKTMRMGYFRGLDSLIVTRPDEEIELNIEMPRGDKVSIEKLKSQLLSPEELQKLTQYQDSLAVLASQKEILSITINKLYCSGKSHDGEMMAEISFHNHSYLPIYVFKNYACMRRLSACVINSAGDTVGCNEVFFDLEGEKCNYDSKDLILVPPGKENRYPRAKIWLCSCSSKSEGNYRVRISYSYELPETFYDIYGFGKDQLMAYLLAIQGNFWSENTKSLKIRHPK